MTLLSYLKQPFPKAENKWKNSVLISVFVTLFLFIFQPFGIGGIENHSIKYLFIGGYGLVSFIVLIFDIILVEHLFRRFFGEKNWRVYKELCWLLFVVSSIGLANALYTISFSSQDLSLAYIINFQFTTFAVAVFPITAFTLSKQRYLLKKHTTSAKDVNNGLKTAVVAMHEKHVITMYSYNEKAKVSFDSQDLYYIESKGNDIDLKLSENELIVSKTLRNTLKKALEYLSDSPDLVQCHRAYIINLSKVKKVEGNSQGLVLELENGDQKIPVSRNFVATIKSKLS